MTKKQWIHHSMKEWGSAKDEAPKSRIQRILRSKGIYVIFDTTIFVNKSTFEYSREQPEGTKEEIYQKYHIFRPDIFSTTHKLIVELDGTFHTDTKKGAAQTSNRNMIYDNMNIRFVQFSTPELEDMTDQEIRNVIDAAIFPVQS